MNNKMNDKRLDCVCLLSGGQDSTTSLFWAKEKFNSVFAVIIDYGQKHRIEIESAKTIAKMANVEYMVISLPFFKEIGNSALLTGDNVSCCHPNNSDLPASFVPGRNLIFVTVASMIAYKRKAQVVVTGVCETDFSGYPDCRSKTIRLLNNAINSGMDSDIKVITPLMYLNKAETVKLALTLNGCIKALAYSHTCYNGALPPCNECPSCLLREKGFDEAGVIDPLIERIWNGSK